MMQTESFRPGGFVTFQRYVTLKRKNEELEEENRQLKELLQPDPTNLPDYRGVSLAPKEKQVLQILMKANGGVTCHRLRSMTYPHGDHSEHIISVMMCHLRKKFKSVSIEIPKGHQGRTYRIPEEMKIKIRALEIRNE